MSLPIRRPVARAVNASAFNFAMHMKKLFANGEQGFWYDPNDLSTMYQDVAGAVPVTAVGQPVGLLLDKSKGLTLGSETIVGGNFENGLIGTVTEGGGSVSEWKLNAVNPISGTQDGKLTVSTPASFRPVLFFNGEAKTIGAVYEVSFDYKVVSGNPVIGLIYNGSSTHSVNKTLTGTGRFTARYVAAGAGASEGFYFNAASPFSLQIDNLSSKRVLGNHAYQTTSASRPILRRNAVTGAYYLEFDGTDDFLQTANIDFTGTDKVSLFTGVRKLSDANPAIVCELSSDISINQGSFYLAAPLNTTTKSFAINARGTIAGPSAFSINNAAPFSAVLSASSDIGGDKLLLRSNALQYISSADLGTGNYGNYPLYIGRRAGTTIPFSGHVYGLISIGKLTSDTETAVIEKELAKCVGVTLNV